MSTATRPEGRGDAPGPAGGVFVSAGPNAAADALALAACLLAPVALGGSCALAVARAAGCRVDRPGLAALVSGIALAYVVDRLREPPAACRRSHLLRRHRIPLVAGAAAAALGLAAAAVARLDALPVLGVLSALVLAYPWLGRVPGGKTLALAAAWSLGATTLAVPAGTSVPLAAPVAVALLLAANGLLCDVKDERLDRRQGTWTPAARAGGAVARATAATLAVAAFVVGAPCGAGPQAGALVLALLATQPRLLETELLGPVVVDLGLALALLL